MYNVLLVDDEMLDLEGMRQFIPWNELGMQVVEAANNAFTACDILEQHVIDIIVSDVNMPNMSGLELARIAIEKKRYTCDFCKRLPGFQLCETGAFAKSV